MAAFSPKRMYLRLVLSKNERLQSQALDDLTRLSEQLDRRTKERDAIVARLHAEGFSIPELSRASRLSVGKVHRIAKSELKMLGTIGYEGRDIDEFVQTLAEREFTMVVDVRLTPMSRRKGFSKNRLKDALSTCGLGYEHMKGLGNPKENRDSFRAGDASARKFFSQILLSNGASDLEALRRTISSERVALLCYEKDHTTCHRSLIADALVGSDRALHVANL